MLDLLKQMIRIRRFEDKCAELYTQEKIRGFLHLYDGEEAVAVGVIPVLESRDRVVATYREHGHALVRGVPMTAALAEMYGKQEGCSRGRGGSMHLFDRATNFYGGNAIVGGGLPLAVGLALADRMRGDRRRHRLLLRRRRGGRRRVSREPEPGRAVGAAGAVRLREQPLRHGHRAGDLGIGDRHPRARPRATGSRPRRSTAWTWSRSRRRHAAPCRRSARAPSPYFLECRTYRFRAHSMFDAQLYRDKAEVESLAAEGADRAVSDLARSQPLVHPDDIARIEAEVADEIADAVAFAEGGTLGAGRAAHPLHLRRRGRPDAHHADSPSRPLEISYRDAVREAIRDALRRDDRVFLMGEDVGRYGGCYAVSKGLLAEFGPERIRDTPLSEVRASSAPASAPRWPACVRSSS